MFECLLFFTHLERYADINEGLKEEFSELDVIVARCIGGGVSLVLSTPRSFNCLLN
jgi:hypothetical protein